jgi:hypothetical protein
MTRGGGQGKGWEPCLPYFFIQSMSNVYYTYPDNRRGVLRAVLPLEAGRHLLKEHSAKYVGQQFPTTFHDIALSVAVLCVFEGEQSAEWPIGFYSFDEDITRIEETVRSCNLSPS